MTDNVNNVKKVISLTDSIVFIIKTEDDDDFWYWQVSTEDVADYFRKNRNALGVYRTYAGTLTKGLAEQFGNDIDNSDKGCSCGGFDTIDEILKDFGILKT